MRAEVISIGDELTSGQRLDTNSQWLSLRLGELGIPVLFHTTVGDDLEANIQVFRQALSRADVVVATGGLGPTADDLTREAIAAAIGVELVQNAAALDHIRSLFARRQRPMPERNLVQALFPRGSQVIPNPHGTAPGINLTWSRPGCSDARLFALPGVPAEMREMWEQTVAPALVAAGAGSQLVVHRRLKCFGVGESDLEQMLPDLIRRGRVPTVGITVSQATITLRITAVGTDPVACQELIAPTESTIRNCLGGLVYGQEDDELQDVLVRLLRDRGQTLAVAEWGTGGLVSEWLSEADPSGRTFVGGMVLRRTPTQDSAADANARWAAEVPVRANQLRTEFSADWALAIGPFPGPNEPEASERRVYFALAGATSGAQESLAFAGHPEVRKPRFGKHGLDLVRRVLLAGPTGSGESPAEPRRLRTPSGEVHP